MNDQVKMLHSVVSLDYERPPTLALREYLDAVRQKRLMGHRCPECGRVYLPPKGYCPVCVVATDKGDEVNLPTTGVLVTYTVLNPDALHALGQGSTCRGTVMLDGTAVPIMGTISVTPAEIHTGMRVRGVWGELTTAELVEPGWGVPGLKAWEPTGEPDVDADEVQRLLSEAT
jgi:uncharacterized OB-fold protein